MRRMIVGAFALTFLSLSAGCTDKAKEPYDKCTQLDTSGDLQGASDACTAAVAADPNSVSGRAASDKLATVKGKLAAQAKADAEAKAKAQAEAAASAQATAQAAAQRLADLQAKVRCALNGFDDHCVKRNKPPKGRDCTGGSDDENEQYAKAKGCDHAHYPMMVRGVNVTANQYCCPE